MIMAGDKDTVEVHNITKSKKLSEFKAHKVRVKDMRFIVEHNLLVTGSNCDQYIKLWRFKDVITVTIYLTIIIACVGMSEYDIYFVI